MLNRPQEILFVTNKGAVQKDGFSATLGKGQFGIVDKGANKSSLGEKVTTTLPANPKDRLFELALGAANLQPGRSTNNKAWRSLPFKLSDVVDIKVKPPVGKGSVDEVYIGYDGINPETALVFENGDNETLDITLFGEALSMLGYNEGKVTVKLHLTAPNEGAFTSQEIVLKGIELLKKTTLIGGIPLTNYVDISPIDSTQEDLTGEDFTFYYLSVNDNGRESDKGAVQAQYPLYQIERKSWVNGLSVYSVLVPAGTVLEDYEVTLTDIMKYCEDCPDGFTASADEKLCVADGEPTTFTWVEGETGVAVEQDYKIQLADTECGEDRLLELQEAYPDLTIKVSTEIEAGGCQTVYETTVLSNPVFEECDPILLDMYFTTSPAPYKFTHWEKTNCRVYDEAALMGIRIKGKFNILAGNEEYRYEIPNMYDSTRISVSSEVGMVNESYRQGRLGRFDVKLISVASRPDSLGMDLRDMEHRAFVHYTGYPVHHDNNFARYVLGEESLLNATSQYVTYNIWIRTSKISGMFSREEVTNQKYIVAAEVGRHKDVEEVVNALATAAGLPTVEAFEY
jgi:hypothetical protein